MNEIAVIGLSCLFPGAKTPQEFYQNLLAKKETSSLATKAQIGEDPELFFHPRKGAVDKFYNTRGGYIHDFKFEPTGYAMPAEVLDSLDDIYKWTLYVAKQALIDAGYFENQKALLDCGLILGNLSFPTKESNKIFIPLYHKAVEKALRNLLGSESFSIQRKNGDFGTTYNSRISGHPASLVAQALSLSGSHLALDAACASSLYSVKIACDYLNSGRQDLMLAGAVSAADPFFVNMGFSTFQAYPENQKSRPLDKNSQGLFAGEGAGMFVLKRLKDAIQDKDRIYAVIDGIGLSNDGRGKFVLSPNQAGQVKAYQRAYDGNGIEPKDVDYIECHATGTPLGDVTEIESLDEFFGQYHERLQVGSVKSNFGHLLTAAGMASMMKIVLALGEHKIPPTIGVEDPLVSTNKIVDKTSVLQETLDWKRSEKPRAAAVNAFGFGGTNAHLVFKEFLPEIKPRTNPQPEKAKVKLAITGMEAIFGTCDGLEDFHAMIANDQDCLIPLPKRRWEGIEQSEEAFSHFGLDPKNPPMGGYLEKIEIDYLRFRVPPNPNDPLIPQQLLMLKAADNAIRDAGIQEGSNVAVIVAMETEPNLHQFRARIELDVLLKRAVEEEGLALSEEQLDELGRIAKDSVHNPVGVNQFTSFIGNIMACRISSLWDFDGPSYTLSSEESSVYKAIETAKMLLENNEVEAVVIGAVDLCGSAESMLLNNAIHPKISVEKAGFGFDKQTMGWSVGEGAGAVVLKRADKSQKDNDRIYAVIDAIGSAFGKKKEKIGQMIQGVLEEANARPEDIGLIEAEGSHEIWSAQKELEQLMSCYKTSGGKPNFALGSIKANIGHCSAASGIASLIKTGLSLYYRMIPGVPAWNGIKSELGLDDQGFYVPSTTKSWFQKSQKTRRKAAINAVALDGTLTHMILSEPKIRQKQTTPLDKLFDTRLFLVTGESEPELQKGLNELRTTIETTGDLGITSENSLKKAQEQKNPVYTISILGKQKQQILGEIQSALGAIGKAIDTKTDWSTPQGSYFTPQPLGPESKIAFVYPGGFNSYLGMSEKLMVLFPELLDLPETYSSNPELLLRDESIFPRTLDPLSDQQTKLKQAELIEDALAMFETGINSSILYTAMARGLLGIEPKAAFGYSMGEVSMAFALGIWDSTDHMSQVLHEKPVFKEMLGGPMLTARKAWGLKTDTKSLGEKIWSCYSIKAGANEVEPYLKDRDKVYMIIVNSPSEVVVAGKKDECDELVSKMPFESLQVPMSDVIHCDIVHSQYDELAHLHNSPVKKIEGIDFYSALDYKPTEITRDQIANNIASIYCKSVDFSKLTKTVYDDGHKIFLELGPRSSCTKWIDETLSGLPHLAVGVDRKGQSVQVSMIKAMAKLFSHKVAVNWKWLYQKEPKVQTSKKSILQSIETGGTPFDQAILTRENRQKFSHVQTKGPNQPVGSKPVATTRPTTTSNPASLIPVPHTQNLTPPEMPVPSTESMSLVAQQMEQRRSVSISHEAFLEARNYANLQLGEMIRLQIGLAQGTTFDQNLNQPGRIATAPHVPSDTVKRDISKAISPKPEIEADPFPQAYPISDPKEASRPKKTGVIWDEGDLLEFARGNISEVFGPDYQIIDNYIPRVRLPMPPYLLVHRVVDLQAEKMVKKPSSITTEFDIFQGAWYSIDGQIPWAIAVEAGQCDLMLISYLGIDLTCKGERVYRLLDCTLTFLDEMPKEGETMRYEIKIKSFAKHGGTELFFFGYECFVGDKKVFTMTDGCAGFFTQAELDLGKGVIRSEKELAERRQIQKSRFEPLIRCEKSRFEKEDLLAIVKGDILQCFGSRYDQGGLNPSLRFAARSIMMLDRVTEIDPYGGLWGLGQVFAEKDMAPDHWYFPCHFKDDNVLAGSLMAEGCVQLLQFYMFYIGLQSKTKDARFQPIKNLPNVVRCRGQALPQHDLLQYRLEVTEIGLEPRPYAKANVDILLDGKVVVDFKDVGVELVEKSTDDPYRIQPISQEEPRRQLAYNENDVIDFATGSLERCFGPEFKIFENRITQRNPNSELQLITRVPETKGERLNFKEVSHLVTEYDVPENAWYFAHNPFPTMPYSMLMEIALQPCGFLGAHMGSCFLFPDEDLCFRNLDGEGTLLFNPDLRNQTITAKIALLSCSPVAKTIVQKYEFELLVQGKPFYQGKTTFGYFTVQAFEKQLGLDRGEMIPPWYLENKNKPAKLIELDLKSPKIRQDYYTTKPDKPYFGLGNQHLDLIERSTLIENGGKFGKGYVYSEKDVDPEDWFFPCHFYQDPVMPGSLGVEAILQSIRIFALHQNLADGFRSPYFATPLTKTKWKYSGQIVPKNKRMSLEVHIKEIQKTTNQVMVTADASLWKDGLRIYHVIDAAISIEEA